MRARFNRWFGLLLVGFPLVFACQATDKGGDDDEAGEGSNDTEGGSCVPKLETCTQNGDCCGYSSGSNYCVDTGTSAICAIACTSGSQCESGCCAKLQGGGSVCAPASNCPDTSCSATGSSCTKNGDCCGFGGGDALCVSGVCAATCSYGSECRSGCCALLTSGSRACGPASVCGG
jgi:hypothetical protein